MGRKPKSRDFFGTVYRDHAVVTNQASGDPDFILDRHRRHAGKVLYLAGKWAENTIKTLRYRLFNIGGVPARRARKKVLKAPRAHPRLRDSFRCWKTNTGCHLTDKHSSGLKTEDRCVPETVCQY